MTIHTRLSRTATVTIAAAATASLFGAAPATAGPAPDPVGHGISIWTCPTRIDAVAQVLRAQGFSAPAAKNFAVFSHEDCGDVT
jgi:hypothetical protein